MSFILTKVDYAKLQKVDFCLLNKDKAIAHNTRSRVETEDDFFFFHFSHRSKIGRVYKFLKLQTMTVVIVSIFLLYILLLIVLVIGWYCAILLKPDRSQALVDEPLVSIIIAARNEESGIGHLLDDLSKQHYEHFQVIIVDDHSSDRTKEIARQFAEINYRFSLLEGEAEGKKQALTQGIRAAEGTIIITTDADCRVPENWINGLRHYFRDDAIKMVFGGVGMPGKSFFSKLQSLEFLSLIGTGAATAALNLPTMCNGANLAFRKRVFEEVGGYSGNLHIPSGDDEFLMRKILTQYPAGVTFAADPFAVVTTSPSRNLTDFIHQRIRWAGKWKLNASFFSKALALFTLCFQAALIVFPFFVLRHMVNPMVAAYLCLGKVGLEILFLRSVSHFLRISWSWPAFMVLQVIYPLYVVIIGIISNFSSFEWKGRKSKALAASSN